MLFVIYDENYWNTKPAGLAEPGLIRQSGLQRHIILDSYEDSSLKSTQITYDFLRLSLSAYKKPYFDVIKGRARMDLARKSERNPGKRWKICRRLAVRPVEPEIYNYFKGSKKLSSTLMT